jgi:hypothetical protein
LFSLTLASNGNNSLNNSVKEEVLYVLNLNYIPMFEISFKDLKRFRVFNNTFYFINNKDGKIYVRSKEKSFEVISENLEVLDVVEVNASDRTYVYYSIPSKIINMFDKYKYVSDYNKNVLVSDGDKLIAADPYGVITVYDKKLNFVKYIPTKANEFSKFIDGVFSDKFYLLDDKQSKNLVIISRALDEKVFCTIRAKNIAVNEQYIIGLFDGVIYVYNKTTCELLTSSYENISAISSWNNNLYAFKENTLYRVDLNITKKIIKEEVITKNETIENKTTEQEKNTFVEEEPEKIASSKQEITYNFIVLLILIVILILILLYIFREKILTYLFKQRSRRNKK